MVAYGAAARIKKLHDLHFLQKLFKYYKVDILCTKHHMFLNSPIKYQSSVFNSGINGLNKENNFMHQNKTNSSYFIYLLDNNTLKSNTPVIHTA
jgi:hypothetical protein